MSGRRARWNGKKEKGEEKINVVNSNSYSVGVLLPENDVRCGLHDYINMYREKRGMRREIRNFFQSARVIRKLPEGSF